MKKNYKFLIYLLLASFLSFSSCSDFLDQVPDEKLNEEILFETKDDALKVLTTVYSFQPSVLGVSEFKKDIGRAGDEADYIWSNYDWYRKDIGQYSASSPIFNNWADYYKGIRYALYFLENIDRCHDIALGEEEREWWKGEANFLIAYYYFSLMKDYGPVPIVRRVYQPSEIESVISEGIPRASMDELANYIDDLLVNEAIPRLDTYSESSRVSRTNKVAAAHLRSRLWLFMASPLYNGMKNPVSGKDYTFLCPKGSDGKELMNTTFDAGVWKKAFDAAKEAIDWTEKEKGRIALYKESGQNGYKAYTRLFNQSRKGVPIIETIFYSQNKGSENFNAHALPVSWTLFSGICPTMEHVDEYFMANGLLPEDDKDYKAIANYADCESYNSAGHTFSISKRFMKRDPRFYANILFPGQYSYAVLGNGVESHDTRWAYSTTGNFTDYMWFRPWYDGPDGFISHTGRDFSVTGMQFIKFVGREDNMNSRGDYQTMRYRLGETYLNYTEAAFELAVSEGRDPSTDPEVFKYWDLLRDRIEIPDAKTAYQNAGIALTTAKLRSLIRNERRIELSMEGHRYYDNRRWLDAEREGGAKHGFNIYNYEVSFLTEVTTFEIRAWGDKMYFMPINQTEIDKNSQMTQNYGW